MYLHSFRAVISLFDSDGKFSMLAKKKCIFAELVHKAQISIQIIASFGILDCKPSCIINVHNLLSHQFHLCPVGSVIKLLNAIHME
jgi:hypothetical protein